MSQDVLLTVMNFVSLNGESVNVKMQISKSCDKCLNLDAEFLKTKQAYNDLLKNYSQFEKHCISLELTIQLNQEIFQKDKSCDNQNSLEIPKYFEINDLKAQLQDKDTTICKLKDIIKSLREKSKEENVNSNKCEISTINEELENSVAKLLSENERLCMFKLGLDPLAPKVLQNRDAHIDYLKHTQEQVDILRGIVKSSNSSDSNTHVLPSTGLKCSTSNCGSKPTGNKKNDRIFDVQGIENGSKTEIFGLDSIKFAHFYKSKQNPRKATSISMERARNYESNGSGPAPRLDPVHLERADQVH
ncbi:hypothetical protein Tco_0744342 [Tanacetum coccineum]